MSRSVRKAPVVGGRPRQRGSALACTLVLATVAIPGCTSGSPSGPQEDAPEISDAWRARIDQNVASGELSEQEREVLEDYWVTDEEYARSRESLPGCMAERGFTSVLSPQGGFSVTADPAFWKNLTLEDPEVEAAMDAAINQCQAGFTWIESYYWDMRSNPQAWDYWEALTGCAERLGLSEGAGMSTEELKVATLESEDFLAECRSDPWSLAQGREPVGGREVED